jgi:hypothetical protein
VRSHNLKKLAVRGEQVMTDCLHVLYCPIGQQESELDHVVAFLAQCLLDLFVEPASIVRMDLLPHRVAGRAL